MRKANAEISAAVIATRMLAGEVGLVEGCRSLVKLRGALGQEHEVLFIPFIAVESETDHLPIGEAARLAWNPQALAHCWFDFRVRRNFARCW
jgi:hypothetical protein